MSNDITKVLGEEIKRLDGEIASLEAQIAKMKEQKAVLSSTVDFYQGGAKSAAPAKRGPKAGAKTIKPVRPATKGRVGRPKKVVEAPAAVAAPAAKVEKVAKAPKAKPGPKAKPAAPKAEKPVKVKAEAKPKAEKVTKTVIKPLKAAKAPKAEKAVKVEKPVKAEKPAKVEKAAKVEKPAANSGSIVARTSPEAAKPTVLKKAAAKTEKPAKATKSKPAPKAKGASLTQQVIDLLTEKGELEPIAVATGVGADPAKFNSVRSTINILYGKGTLVRRKVDGKINTYTYGLPSYFEKQGIAYESGKKK